MRALNRNDVNVASNPEFLAEGSAANDCLFLDRIVIGATSYAVPQNVADLYGPVGSSRLIFSDLTSEALIKYASKPGSHLGSAKG